MLAVACMGGRKRESGRLAARPVPPAQSLEPGVHAIDVGSPRDAYLFVPSKTATKLILALHGATGAGERFIRRMQPYAGKIDAIVVAPSSREHTWDAIGGSFGADVPVVDRTLEFVFRRAAIDPKRVAIAGFSDGATYALSLGLTNGDLFSHVMAFSPGFIVSPSQQGSPRVFVSHGDADEILPIERCGRPVAARLARAGYDVRYREFEGGHAMPPEVVTEAMEWFAR